jgi:hypothetical protein
MHAIIEVQLRWSAVAPSESQASSAGIVTIEPIIFATVP